MGRKAFKTSNSKTPTSPANAAGRPSSAGATHVEAALNGVQETLDAMEQKIDQLRKQVEVSMTSKDDVSTQLKDTGVLVEKLRVMAETKDRKIDQLLVKMEQVARQA